MRRGEQMAPSGARATGQPPHLRPLEAQPLLYRLLTLFTNTDYRRYLRLFTLPTTTYTTDYLRYLLYLQLLTTIDAIYDYWRYLRLLALFTTIYAIYDYWRYRLLTLFTNRGLLKDVSGTVSLMDINFKILQSKYFNDKFSTYIL